MGLGISNATPVGSTNSSGVYQTAGAQLRAATGIYTPSYATVAGKSGQRQLFRSGRLVWRRRISHTNNNPGKTNPAYTAGNLLRYNGYPGELDLHQPAVQRCNLEREPGSCQLPFDADAGNAAADAWTQPFCDMDMEQKPGYPECSGSSKQSRGLWVAEYSSYPCVNHVWNVRSALRAESDAVLECESQRAGTHHRRMAAELGPHHADRPPGLLSLPERRCGPMELRIRLASSTIIRARSTGSMAHAQEAFTGIATITLYVNVKDPQCLRSESSQPADLRARARSMRLRWHPILAKIIFQNPLPGVRGNYDPTSIYTPMTWNTDMAFTKAIRIAEGKSMQIRVDATNVWNHAQPTRGQFGSAGSRSVAPGDFLRQHHHWKSYRQPRAGIFGQQGRNAYIPGQDPI